MSLEVLSLMATLAGSVARAPSSRKATRRTHPKTTAEGNKKRARDRRNKAAKQSRKANRG